MSSTFIALPLTSGDAFLLRTEDKDGKLWNILVDSGKKYGANTRELAKILSQVSPKVEHVDIAVCTHQDADHANGFWFFAEDWYDMGRTIGEYWLPGRWANAMPSILTNPGEFAARLMDGAEESSIRIAQDDFVKRAAENSKASEIIMPEAKLRLFARHSEALTEDFSNLTIKEPDTDGTSELDHAKSFSLTVEELNRLRDDLEETDDNIDPLEVTKSASSFPFTWSRYLIEGADNRADFLKVEMETRVSFMEAMDTATAIRKISVSAIKHGIKVRWFDFGKYEFSGTPSGGNPGVLEPVCSVEVFPKPLGFQKMSNFALLVSLRLSRQNVESLVFYRPENENSAGVLFLGDSRLAYGVERPKENFEITQTKPTRRIVVTAPHHGSNKNDRAYEVLKNWLGDEKPIFIRNGGQSNQTLDGFLKNEDRRCAQCVQCHGNKWNQWVAVNAVAGDWQWPPKADACGTPRT